jgi:hypothetical protein
MHEPMVEFLPSLVVLGTSAGAVGAHLLVRMRAAVPAVGKADSPQDQDGQEAEIYGREGRA